ncbi:MAG: peptidoglycan DD-metalloendopeptidase family protein [Nannocystaceae bacterium]
MRSEQAWMVPVAPIPTPKPRWPLVGVNPNYSATSLGYKRPFQCTDDCVRWHAGLDLVGVKPGDEVVACEDCEVVRTGLWSHETTFVFVRNPNTMALYGGVTKSSAPKKGTFVAAGKPIGKMGEGYGGLHFELYELDPNRSGNSRWYIDAEPPDGLLNPVNYVQAAAGHRITRETAPQRHEALRELGVYAGTVFGPWTDASTEALKTAQTMLGLTADGIWGPKTEVAIDTTIRGEPQTGGSPSSGGGKSGDTKSKDTKTKDTPEDTPEQPTRATLAGVFSVRNVLIAGAVGVAAALLWPKAEKGSAA